MIYSQNPSILTSRMILCVVLLLGVVGCAGPHRAEREWEASGLPASVVTYTTTESGSDELIDEIALTITTVHASMGLEHSGSELLRLNRGAADKLYEIPDRSLYQAIDTAIDYAQASGGAFDPTVGPLRRLYAETEENPSPERLDATRAQVGWSKVILASETIAVRFREPGVEIDLRDILQGYSLDLASRRFARPGTRAGLLKLGSAVYAWQHPPDEPSWSVPIVDPRDPELPFVSFQIANRAVGTVAGPLLDPRTGRPAETDVLAAVALADAAADAQAISRALLVGGSQEAGAFLSKLRRVEAVLLVRGRDGEELLVSASLRGKLTVSDELRRSTGGRLRELLPPSSL